MSLTAEQRRALAMLTHAGLNGASQASLMAHGFCVSMIAGLAKRGFATLTREKVWTGSRLVDIGKVRITAAGRDALGAERWRSTLWAWPRRVPEQDLQPQTESDAEVMRIAPDKRPRSSPPSPACPYAPHPAPRRRARS
jgi:hypothetical protein